MGALEAIQDHWSQQEEPLPFQLTLDDEHIIIIEHRAGTGRTVMVEPMEGVVLSHHRMSLEGFGVSTKGVGDGIKINYCISGRLEVSMERGRTLYMAPGTLSVETSTAWSFSFPCGFYEGIELFLPKACLADPPALFREAGIDLRGAVNRLSTPRMRNWTRKADDETKGAFTALIAHEAANDQAWVRLSIAQLILMLAQAGTPPKESDSAIFTRRQVELAKRAERMLAGDLTHRRSVAEVAGELGIAPTTLKGYFEGVFGVCVSRHLADARMSRARDMLTEGNAPVAEVAHAVGFTNVGKFCEAFRKANGATPLQYRKQHHSK